MSTKEIVEKVVVGLIGLTVSVSAFLMRTQLEELTQEAKTNTHLLHQLQIETAVMAKDIQLHRDWLQSYQGRLQYVEARVERFNTLLERK